jgi:hypothetical protein
MIGPILFTTAWFMTGSYGLVFAMLAVPAAAGLACVFAAQQLVARRQTPDAGVLLGDN